jgi:hypothetical protein
MKGTGDGNMKKGKATASVNVRENGKENNARER